MKPKDTTPPISARDILSWPDGVAQAVNMSAPALQRQRAQGDAPKLYAITERKLVTTGADLLEWIRNKAVPTTYKCRPAVQRGTRKARVTEAAQ